MNKQTGAVTLGLIIVVVFVMGLVGAIVHDIKHPEKEATSIERILS